MHKRMSTRHRGCYKRANRGKPHTIKPKLGVKVMDESDKSHNSLNALNLFKRYSKLFWT